MFIELHLIQNFAPANLNRDDTNNPKDCTFGGHRRARISSQALKRAIRYEPVFAQTTQSANGERSKWMTKRLKDNLIAAGKDKKEATAVSAAFVNDYYAKWDKKNPEKSSVLIYFSQEEVATAVTGLLENWDEAVSIAEKGKTITNAIKTLQAQTKERTSAPDIALFGRMLAENPTLNIDAACQVAHAISTHRISMEMDFYTAVDDIPNVEDSGAGAGMMGFTPFNSACFYRYARIDWRQLRQNLDNNDDLARRTVEGFLRAAMDAIPTGKQNSFAAQNPTSLAIAIVREDGRTWNLANAFETPIYPRRDTGIIQPTIQALDKFWGQLTRARDDARFNTVAVHTVQYADQLDELQAYYQPSMTAWINAIKDALPQE